MSAQVRCPDPDKASVAERGLLGVDAPDEADGRTDTSKADHGSSAAL